MAISTAVFDCDPAQLSVVKICSAVVPESPKVSKTCCFSAAVSADDNTVDKGVSATALDSSAGKSATRTRSGNALPVVVSVPPREMIFGLQPAAAATFPALKKPFSSVMPVGSPSSFKALQFKSTKTSAPETGPSITRPSKASSTAISIVKVVESTPSLAITSKTYRLFSSASPGSSKSGAETNVKTPSVRSKSAASAPPKLSVTASPSASVAASDPKSTDPSTTDKAPGSVIAGAVFASSGSVDSTAGSLRSQPASIPKASINASK